MKNISAAVISLFCFAAQAQVLEKPQLVEKIDTSVVIEQDLVPPPVEITEVWAVPDSGRPQYTAVSGRARFTGFIPEKCSRTIHFCRYKRLISVGRIRIYRL